MQLRGNGMAIRIRTKKAEGNYDVGLSKMLGNPVLPEGIDESLPSTAMFLMQIRLEDIKDLDEENVLPHTGYLYFFLDTENGPYSLTPIVIFYNGEPTHHIDGFNDIVMKLSWMIGSSNLKNATMKRMAINYWVIRLTGNIKKQTIAFYSNLTH